MRIYTTARTSFTSASTLAAPTSANVKRICTLLMGNAEVMTQITPKKTFRWWWHSGVVRVKHARLESVSS